MDVYEMRKQLRGHSIYELPLRVTYYARVSTDTDEQLNSLENQTTYYDTFIRSHAAWTLVPGYVDEGISGISVHRRERFLDMITDAKHGRFDMIVTKEISRFARNTVDSIRYTRELLNDGVCVFFQNDNINTIDEDSELRLTIMSGIAQDELRRLSSRVKFGHQQAIKNGVVLGNSRIFGYRKDDKRLVIDEYEAKMVRMAFELYATGQYSMKEIENRLWDAGYRNHNGNKISHTTLSNVIANPKYKGYYVGNKVKVIDLFTKKQKFLPPEDWVMFKDETGEIVPAIVSEETWDKANAILAQRSRDVKDRLNKCTHNNLLTGKLICTHCGAPYYRKDSMYRGKRRSRWVCSGKIKNGADSCPSFIIDEADIRQAIFDVFANTQEASRKYIAEYIRLFKSLTMPDYQAQIDSLQAIINREESKQSKLLELYMDGTIEKREFQRMNDKCATEAQAARDKLDDIDDSIAQQSDVVKEFEELQERLIQAADDAVTHGTISMDFVNKYIDSILVTPKEQNVMSLNIRLFSGIRAKSELSRTGHMSNIICPERPTIVQRANWKSSGQKIQLIYETMLSF